MMLRRGANALAAFALVVGHVANAAVPQTAPPTPTSAVYIPQDKDERGLWMQVDEEERALKTSNFVIRDAALNAYVHRVFCRTVGRIATSCACTSSAPPM